MTPFASFASLSPQQALLRLKKADLTGVILLESAGPVLPYSRYSFLSAQPSHIQHTLPDAPQAHDMNTVETAKTDTSKAPASTAFFPAWLGGLKYEAASVFGLSTVDTAHPHTTHNTAQSNATRPTQYNPAQYNPTQHDPHNPQQWWGWYPSGLVWDREQETLELIGCPHLDWHELLLGSVDSSPSAQTHSTQSPSIQVGPFGEDDLDYSGGVRTIQEWIRAGEVYQVNLSRGVKTQAQGEPLAAYLRLRELNPSPFMVYADLDDEVVVSCSPERLITWQGDLLAARPIAGTRRRGDTPAEDVALEAELRSSSKEIAEHTMLVDLVRHDLGAVAKAGSVYVPDLMLVERYSHVMHLVSEVQATIQADATLFDVLKANFPGGTITGAPKARVMDAIAELEVAPRGWYTGSFGILAAEHIDLNILIRTADFRRIDQTKKPQTEEPARANTQHQQNEQKHQQKHWQITVRAGGGTVIDADPHREAKETVHKAQALLSALAGHKGRPAQPPQPPVSGVPWQPPRATSHHPLRVLLLDNRDSFTWNIAHDLMSLGAQVSIHEQTEPATRLLATQPQAILIGPGPGTPQTSGCTLELASIALERRIPLLGVCLGHQALGELLGGRTERLSPVHGRFEHIHHNEQGLFKDIPQGAAFGRYHSLVIRGLPETLITAHSKDREVMALKAPDLPAWGVQFHPESVLSPLGRVLLGNWLNLAYTHTRTTS